MEIRLARSAGAASCQCRRRVPIPQLIAHQECAILFFHQVPFEPRTSLLWEPKAMLAIRVNGTGRQAGHRDILLDIPMCLLGSAPRPRPDALAFGQTRLTAWLCRSRWSLLPAHPRRKFGVHSALQPRLSRPGVLMCHDERHRINDNQLPSQLSRIAHGRTGAAPKSSVIDSQHQRGKSNERTITL